jgi:hypothetical protein
VTARANWASAEQFALGESVVAKRVQRHGRNVGTGLSGYESLS